jgi:polysaccharide biosynthesis protein PslG
MHQRMSAIVARVATVVLLITAMAGIDQRSNRAFIFAIGDVDTADQDSEQDTFGALLTSDSRPKAVPAC